MSLRLSVEEYSALCSAVLYRDGWKCRYCGLRNNLTVHHIIFRSDGGPDESWNLITLCNSCHNGVHVDVLDGVYGLVITQPANADEEVAFVRHPLWHPE